MLEKVIENWTSRLDYIRASRGSPMPEIIFKLAPGQRLPDDACSSLMYRVSGMLRWDIVIFQHRPCILPSRLRRNRCLADTEGCYVESLTSLSLPDPKITFGYHDQKNRRSCEQYPLLSPLCTCGPRTI
ncbi:hypothetical protein TNCV_947251 [Trichonephila clavipes]|nr:hypothetical protein TNCV_947251 [Trichonephila clavipes]